MVYRVALLAEGVGRNRGLRPNGRESTVALLAEGVGRNDNAKVSGDARVVALLAEGVGRNASYQLPSCAGALSPSSRRAWVEIIR